ncbi:MAG: DUF222 domain-containing protein [Actinomycetes bacterium]
MGELSSALDELAADDLHAMFAPQLLERTALLLSAANRIMAELTRTVRAADTTQASEHDGLKTMASWLRGHGHLSPAAAARLVATGRALEQLPAVAARFADGDLTAEQATVIAAVAKPEHVSAAAAQGVDLGEVDRALAEVAVERPCADLGRVVAHYLDRLDPDGPEPDPTESRSLAFVRHDDGRLSFRGELDTVGGEKFLAAVESIVQANRPAGDTRTRSQQQADALVQLMDNQLASGNLPFLRTVKPHVFVTIDVDDLADPATGPGAGETGFGAMISAARTRWLTCDGSVSRVVMGPDGRTLDLGRDHRLFPPHIRRALELRDKGCVFAGCHAPTYWCDAHHLLEWEFGGETSEDNGGLLCERHHTKVHHGFRIERDTDARWHTYRPDGSEIHVPAVTAVSTVGRG